MGQKIIFTDGKRRGARRERETEKRATAKARMSSLASGVSLIQSVIQAIGGTTIEIKTKKEWGKEDPRNTIEAMTVPGPSSDGGLEERAKKA